MGMLTPADSASSTNDVCHGRREHGTQPNSEPARVSPFLSSWYISRLMQLLSDILGQERAIRWLGQALAADRLPHGLLFAGPVGVGKATTAAALAAVFLCPKPHGDRPCGRCPSCTVFAAGNHPDYHLIYRQLARIGEEGEEVKVVAKDLIVRVIRDHLLEPAARTSSLGRGKVFVIEEADRMNAAAQNALLKTLEEPQGRTLLMLLSDQPLALLPTIRSRCQLLRFSPLTDEIVRSELAKRRISSAEAADATDLASGSLGLALRWLEDGVVARARELRTRVGRMIEGESMLDLPDWLRVAGDEYAAAQQKRDPRSSKDQGTREGASLYLHLMSQLLAKKLKSEPPPVPLDRICSAIETIARSDRLLDANVTVALIFQELAVKLENLFAYVSH
jgi:DNA polymerase III subunit delta'